MHNRKVQVTIHLKEVVKLKSKLGSQHRLVVSWLVCLPDAEGDRFMKRVASRAKECRSCKRYFNVIRGVVIHDHRCCSDTCFLKVGKIVREAVAPMPIVKPKRTYQEKQRKEVKSTKAASRDFYNSQAWLQLRYAVIRNYGRECMACGETGGTMQVDHIKPRSIYPELALAYTNLQVLCKACNEGKSNTDDKDFRDKIIPYDSTG